MGILKKVFAGPELAGEAMDGVKRGLDALVFTNEERATADAGVREFMLAWLNATQPQNLARRYIAFAVVGLWVGLVLVVAASRAFAPEYSAFVFDLLTDVVTIPFSGIMVFYFGAHLLRSYAKQ